MRVLLVGLLLASPVLAQDGGKLAWRGKGNEDPRSAFADARAQGRPLMLYFTSDG